MNALRRTIHEILNPAPCRERVTRRGGRHRRRTISRRILERVS
jgi:hypothetical protein